MPADPRSTPPVVEDEPLTLTSMSTWSIPDEEHPDFTFTRYIVKVDLDADDPDEDVEPTEIATVLVGIFTDVLPERVVITMDEPSQATAELSAPFVHDTVELIYPYPPDAWNIAAIESLDIAGEYDLPARRARILLSVIGRLARHCHIVLAFADETGLSDPTRLVLGKELPGPLGEADMAYLGNGVVGCGLPEMFHWE